MLRGLVMVAVLLAACAHAPQTPPSFPATPQYAMCAKQCEKAKLGDAIVIEYSGYFDCWCDSATGMQRPLPIAPTSWSAELNR